MPSLKICFPLSEALVIIRGQKVLKVKKLDYTKNPEAQKFVAVKAAEHVPGWRAEKAWKNEIKEEAGRKEWRNMEEPSVLKLEDLF